MKQINTSLFVFRFAIICALLSVLACSAAPEGAIETPKTAKNVILMIGDGCGFNHEDATRFYVLGEDGKLAQQDLDVKLAMSTYMVNGSYDPDVIWQNFEQLNKGATDSAAAGTAMASGKKTYKGAIGFGPEKNPLVNVTTWAETLGKSTGVISSVEFSHATPAAYVAHNEKRNNYQAIAREMLAESPVDVLIGCGHPLYDNNGKKAKEPEYKFVGGKETWDKLVAGELGADADADGTPDPWAFYETSDELLKVPVEELPKRIAIVPRVHQTLSQRRGGEAKAKPYEVDFIDGVPRLHELTSVALKSLQRDPDGFFLMVEGGAIDWASHANQTGRMIEETIEFSSAIEVVIDWIEKNGGFEENLLIITADHETGYLTGPISGVGTPPELWTPVASAGKGLMPASKWNSGNHTNSLVPFHAQGPGADVFKTLVRGEDPKFGPYIDNTDIAPVILSLWGVIIER
jgi:alkaline phosphatase